MSTRVYLLLQLANGNKANVADAVKGMPGIATVDILESPPDLLMVIEARDRQKAAEHLMGIFDVVDGVVEDIRVLPVCESAGKSTSLER